MTTPDRQINLFQREAREAITSLVGTYGTYVKLSEAGKNEIYLCGEIESHKIKLWIYDDELEFKAGSNYLLLERSDFESSDEMLRYFLDQLTSELKNT